MTRDDIIRMAREAGLTSVIDAHHKEYGSGAFDLSLYEEVERFFHAAYAAGAAAEREECAKVCADNALKVAAGYFRRGQNDYFGGDYFARAIRARSKK